MAKRFSSTEIWNEDWFIESPQEYKLFWFYILSSCNHAGLYKVNFKSFSIVNGLILTPSKALDYFNTGKQRIRAISETLWFIEDFIPYQYGNTLNLSNRVHLSIFNELQKHEIDLKSIRGLKGLKEGVKDKDKDIIVVEEIVDTTARGIKPPSTAAFSFPGKPLPEDVPDPPPAKVQSVRERQYQLGHGKIDEADVLAYWKSWLENEATGERYYANASDVHTKFFYHCGKNVIKPTPPKNFKDAVPHIKQANAQAVANKYG